jgi:hypothetical protein
MELWTIELLLRTGWAGSVQRFRFSSRERADAEYERIRGILVQAGKRENDVPANIDVEDDFGRGSYPTSEAMSVRIVNVLEWARADLNSDQVLRDEFAPVPSPTSETQNG